MCAAAGYIEARRWLQESVSGTQPVEFRAGQWEAIDCLVNHDSDQRLLVVQATGWGKSIVYFISARLLRQRHNTLTVIISPLISLMRNQVLQAEKMGVRAVAIHYSNQDEWPQYFQVPYSTGIRFAYYV